MLSKCNDFFLNNYLHLHTEKTFRNLIKSNRNQIVITIFRLIWNDTDVRLVPHLSQNGKYNLISVWFNKVSKNFLYVWMSSIFSWNRKIWFYFRMNQAEYDCGDFFLWNKMKFRLFIKKDDCLHDHVLHTFSFWNGGFRISGYPNQTYSLHNSFLSWKYETLIETFNPLGT